jgi:CheY-like chemotaxis protein
MPHNTSKRILVVNDQADVNMTLLQVLEDNGFKVRIV